MVVLVSLTHSTARDRELSFLWVGCAELLKVKSGGGKTLSLHVQLEH